MEYLGVESAAMVVRIKLHGVRCKTVRKMVAQGAEMVEVGCMTELLDARRRWRCCSWWPEDVKVRGDGGYYFRRVAVVAGEEMAATAYGWLILKGEDCHMA